MAAVPTGHTRLTTWSTVENRRRSEAEYGGHAGAAGRSPRCASLQRLTLSLVAVANPSLNRFGVNPKRVFAAYIFTEARPNESAPTANRPVGVADRALRPHRCHLTPGVNPFSGQSWRLGGRITGVSPSRGRRLAAFWTRLPLSRARTLCSDTGKRIPSAVLDPSPPPRGCSVASDAAGLTR
jgi:hypothetical protein